MSLRSASDSVALGFAVNGDSPPTSTVGNPPRLLLVDDDPMVLGSLCELLDDFGYVLVTARCAAEAIDLLDKYPFDLALLDLQLPDHTGHAIMDHINTQRIDVTVVVLSGVAETEGAVGALKRGAYDYLRKPYDRRELFKTIENALQQRRLENENRSVAWRLECSEKRYRPLVENLPDIVFMLNQDGQFTFINNRARMLLGFDPRELVGKHFSVLVHPEDFDRAQHVFNERRVGERASYNVEFRLECDHGNDRERVVENTSLDISINSMGMYSLVGTGPEQAFFGTYGVARDITECKRVGEIVSYQAYHDTLTDLPNRLLFKDRLGLALIQAKRNGTELAVMFLDLDRFKWVNDTLGHIKGDDLLQQAARRLEQGLRRGDTLARYGGDEFIVFLPALRNRHDVEIVADKFIDAFCQPFILDGDEARISVSIGSAIFPSDGVTVDELVRCSDIAMYHVKELGKNGHAFFDRSMLEASYEKIAVEQSLRRALERNELELYYQPQVSLPSGRIVGAEALMRWNHPERGLLTASEFLPSAEESGVIIPFSDWMLATVCRDILQFNARGGEPIQFALNISPHYIDRPDFLDKIRGTLSGFGISPSQIDIEISESICIRSPLQAIEQLNKLSQLGVNLTIDDFGTGYSSLSYLHRFPIHTIKIDRSFVRQIADENGHFPVVLAIISIASGLGFNLVAEGVETPVQASYLAKNGCTTMQGHNYYRPLPGNQFLDLLKPSGR